MADKKRVIRAEEFELLNRGTILGLQSGRGNNQRNVMARVGVHDLVCTYGPINPLDFGINPRVLNDHRRRLRRLAVPHFVCSYLISQVNNSKWCSFLRRRAVVLGYEREERKEIMKN